MTTDEAIAKMAKQYTEHTEIGKHREKPREAVGLATSAHRGISPVKTVFKSILKANGRGFVGGSESGVGSRGSQEFVTADSVLVAAANEAQVMDDDVETEVVASSGLCEAANESGDWIRIARYGDWPHPMGLQRFTRQSADEMARRFRSSVERVKRFLGLHRVPVYRGHPDDPAFANEEGHEDTFPHAWVTDLEAREDGLYAKREWSNESHPNKRGVLPKKFSPRWAMRRLGGNVFEPVKLISVGLTDHPNIPDFSNQKRKQKEDMNLLKKLLEVLGFSNAQIEAVEKGTDGAPSEKEIVGKIQGALAASNTVDETKTELATANVTIKTEKTAREKAESDLKAAREDSQRHQTAFANERQARIGLLLDDAVSNSRITEADRPTWERRLKDASDFDGEVASLSKQTTSFANAGRTPKTEDLGKRDAAQADKSRKFRDAVDERCNKTGEKWEVAWANCKKDPELKGLLEATAETGV